MGESPERTVRRFSLFQMYFVSDFRHTSLPQSSVKDALAAASAFLTVEREEPAELCAWERADTKHPFVFFSLGNFFSFLSPKINFPGSSMAPGQHLNDLWWEDREQKQWL